MGNGKLQNYKEMMSSLNSLSINNWLDISKFISSIKSRNIPPPLPESEYTAALRKGIAFFTYDYGIDGVSIEMNKYASCFEKILADSDGNVPAMHFIGGEFHDKAEAVLKEHWRRFQIDGINGWSKWDNGKWFSKLYYEEMPEDSDISKETAKEIWQQTLTAADKLGKYIAENNISLLFPVNIFSNPGNFTAALTGIIVSEMMGLYVFNSNHDFYWEGGAPASERKNGEKGPRDHFFKNINNRPFFELFKMIYPWNGEKWAQVNINTQQSEELEAKFGFPKEKLFELSTSISDEFFKEYTKEDVKQTRLTMAHILSDGKPLITPKPVKEHFANLAEWMKNQHPLVCGNRAGLSLDLTSDKIIYCLQPTRVISRKRIEKDLHLIKALFDHEPFRKEFEEDQEKTILLHITGPVPIEHQCDLETILNAYIDTCTNIPANFADRIFIAFSVGTEDHPSLKPAGLERLRIENIYRLATLILFPSETEGRGLPIIEASACGIPIVCSRYYPEDVFIEVVGEKLEQEKQIIYTLFPEGEFSTEFLNDVTRLMLSDNRDLKRVAHNKIAVNARYGTGVLVDTFNTVLERLNK
jgi:glycosyltransferase involved in cell wall biosynthesis